MALEARALVRVFSAVVVNISYRLAPEHKFPQAWEDAWDNLVWLVDHAADIGADPSRGIVMGGTSAGASRRLSALGGLRLNLLLTRSRGSG